MLGGVRALESLSVAVAASGAALVAIDLSEQYQLTGPVLETLLGGDTLQ